jgi:phytoene dehydrogenase-like protein
MMLGNNRPWGVAKGGMGAITQAMAAFLREKGGEIRTEAGVAKILVESGKAIGVRLMSGEEIRAKVIAANTDPRRTFLTLVGEEHLPPDFAADLRTYRMGTASFKINLALKGLPRFAKDQPGVESERHRALVNMVDSWAGIDESYRNAAAGIPGLPATVQMLNPSMFDDSLAPAGQHVASLACKYFPYDLAGGKSWNDLREEVGERILAWVERFVPGLKDLIVGRQFIAPLDLEQEYGLSRGCIHHGRLDPDQIWNMRPHPDAAQYRTPIKNLYLCGAGAHPGGGVTGAPGHNAARRVLKDFRKLA